MRHLEASLFGCAGLSWAIMFTDLGVPLPTMRWWVAGLLSFGFCLAASAVQMWRQRL